MQIIPIEPAGGIRMVPLLEAAFRAADRLPPYEQTLLAERLFLELCVESPPPMTLAPPAPSNGSAATLRESTPDTRPR